VAIIPIEAVDYSVNIMLNPSYYRAVSSMGTVLGATYIPFSTATKIVGTKARLQEIQ